MTDKAIRSMWGITEDESLETLLARSRVAPDYTMGALAQQTGVPPDTLRSWERRYGFPDPVRTETNRRLYSERDIVAVAWLRDQTERGQGISEAIAMLRSRMPGITTAPKEHSPSLPVQPSPPPARPLDRLVEKLIDGGLDRAQSAWDELVIALSPEAIGIALLELQKRLRSDEPSDRTYTFDRALAFLQRKATVLLDHAGPDNGQETVSMVTSGSPNDELTATVLAAALARAGFRIITPFLRIGSLTAVEAAHHTSPDHVILVGTTDEQAATYTRLMSGIHILRWAPSDRVEFASQVSGLIDQARQDH